MGTSEAVSMDYLAETMAARVTVFCVVIQDPDGTQHPMVELHIENERDGNRICYLRSEIAEDIGRAIIAAAEDARHLTRKYDA